MDVLDYQPGYVKTGLVGSVKMSLPTSAEKSVRGCLRDVGHDMVSTGPVRHAITKLSGDFLPQWIIDHKCMWNYRKAWEKD